MVISIWMNIINFIQLNKKLINLMYTVAKQYVYDISYHEQYEHGTK